MDLTTRYLGLKLSHPFMPGASPLVDDLDIVLRLEDAGASAIVMHSLFEEQIVARAARAHARADRPRRRRRPKRSSYFPGAGRLSRWRPSGYLEQLTRIKQRVGVPVIASLNGTTAEGLAASTRGSSSGPARTRSS